MPAFHLFAAAHRGGQHIYADERLSAMGEMSVAKLLQSEKEPNQRLSPCLHALVLLLCNFGLWMICATIMSALERDTELTHRTSRAEVLMMLNGSLSANDYLRVLPLMGLSQEFAAAEIEALDEPNGMETLPGDWDFSGSFFSCFTLATTLGYGFSTPRTVGCRMFIILYVFFAIPLCLSMYANVGGLNIHLVARRLSP